MLSNPPRLSRKLPMGIFDKSGGNEIGNGILFLFPRQLCLNLGVRKAGSRLKKRVLGSKNSFQTEL